MMHIAIQYYNVVSDGGSRLLALLCLKTSLYVYFDTTNSSHLYVMQNVAYQPNIFGLPDIYGLQTPVTQHI